MCNETKWFGVYFPNAQWLKNGNNERIVFDNEEAANTALTNWHKESKWLDGKVKEFVPAPEGCVLYS